MHPSPDVLALLALGEEEAGTPAEREHIDSCPQCRADIADLARAVAAGRRGAAGDSELVSPPDRVWTAIRAELGFSPRPEIDEATYGTHGRPEVATTTPLPRPARVDTDDMTPDEPSGRANQAPAAGVSNLADARNSRDRTSRGRRGLALLVAAAVALVLGVGLGFGLDRIFPRQTVLWTAELQALPSFAGSSGQATVQEDSRGRRTLVIELDSPEPVDGSRHVWLLDRGAETTRPLGTLVGSSGEYAVPADLDPRQFPVVDVSKEPPGDTEARHSGVSIVRGTLNV